MNRANQIQRSQARLDHQQVRAFLRTTTVELIASVRLRNIELVMTAIAELRRWSGSITKWALGITRNFVL